MEHNPVYYGEYLQLDKIINAQEPVSFPGDNKAHDEMLFIIIHQAYELWFKQVLFEVDSVIAIMEKPEMNDNSPEMQTVVHRLQRVVTIIKVLVQQIDILETMTPMDFLDFRDMLRPASGFQSWQFKIIEARLGLKFEDRHGQHYYTSQLKQPEIDLIKDQEEKSSLLQLLNKWLERMPFFNTEKFWKNYQPIATSLEQNSDHPFWKDYKNIYTNSLAEAEKINATHFDNIFFNEENKERNISASAARSAL
ncbi:MAG: tryptophan 2,3-dioxygenase family protein, partial [Ferruginibacter sp.]